MTTKSCRRAAAALAAAACLSLLAPPPARAAGRWSLEDLSPRGWITAAWGHLASLWGEEGVTADPNGAPRAGAAADTGARGPRVVWGAEGMTADPNGTPRTGATAGWSDEGMSADPNG